MSKLNLLLVEDEALIREGLRSLLEKEQFVKMVYEASNEREFKSEIQKHIDIVLMDFRLPGVNGLELFNLIKNEPAPPKVIVLTGLEGTELIINLLKAGVHGIVYKLDGYKEIVNTINRVLEMGSYFSDKIVNIIQSNAHRWDHVPTVLLTLPEKEMLKAIANGLTTKEISALLKMTEATAETYRIRLTRKVGVHNTAGLLAYAYRNGIL